MKKSIKKLFRYFGIRISKFENTTVYLEPFIIKYAKQDKDFFFVQIGANDGIRYDPIYKIVNELGIKGLVVEPVQEYYEDLVSNYSKNKNVITENSAIYSNNEEIFIYRVKSNSDLPDWVNGIASLDKDHHLKSNTPSENIVEEKVKGITFDTLFKKHNVKKIDFLQVDAEGYDYDLIKMFPFDRFRPKLIHFEHSLRTKNMTYEQYDEINSYLIRMGYKTIMNENDTICFL